MSWIFPTTKHISTPVKIHIGPSHEEWPHQIVIEILKKVIQVKDVGESHSDFSFKVKVQKRSDFCSQWRSNTLIPATPSQHLFSVQFSHSVMSNSLRPHEPQHARSPCPSPTPGVYSNPCPSSWWCHLAISSSVVPFSSCPQSLPASRSFPMSQLSAWGGQSIGVSASASVLPMNTQDWSPLGWTGWISLQSKGLSRVFSNTTVQKHQFFGTQFSSQSNSHIHTWPLFWETLFPT